MPAGTFGRSQRVAISPMSGLSGVRHRLQQHGYDGADEMPSGRLFSAADRSDHTLTADEVHALCAAHTAGRAEDPSGSNDATAR